MSRTGTRAGAGPEAGVCRRGFGVERTSVGPGDLRGEGGLLAPRGAGAERVGDLAWAAGHHKAGHHLRGAS